MKIKPSTAFSMLSANRKADSRASKSYAVVSLTKAGVPSKSRPSDLCLADTHEAAEVILARMISNNPGRQFVIIER